MKKKAKDKEQQRKPRRLILNRETIRFLDDSALLGLARGGWDGTHSSGATCTTTTVISGDNC